MKNLSFFLLFVVCTCLAGTNNVFAQKREFLPYKGKVTDLKGAPLKGVYIYVPGTYHRGTVTNPDGDFLIEAKDKESICFSYVGMKDILMQLDKNKTSGLHVKMEQAIFQLSDVIISKTQTVKVKDVEDIPDECYCIIEKGPEFPGGMSRLNNYVEENLHYPDEAFQAGEEGQVTVEFTINREGYVCNAQVTKSVSDSLDKEALRIVESLPRWSPAVHRGFPIEVRISLPIDFVIPLEYKVG